MAMLADLLDEEEMASTLPEAARSMFGIMVDTLAELDKRIETLDREIAKRAREDEAAWRLMTIPGIDRVRSAYRRAGQDRKVRAITGAGCRSIVGVL